MAETGSDRIARTPPLRTNSGPGRVLIAVYLLFAIAATSRAGYQLITKFGEAPVAYLLSAVAAAIYIVATVGLSRGGTGGRRVAYACLGVELVGVLAVGFLSVFDPELFPHDTVWSKFGQGYGYVPLVLPVLGLLWLRRSRPAGHAAGPDDAGQSFGPPAT